MRRRKAVEAAVVLNLYSAAKQHLEQHLLRLSPDDEELLVVFGRSQMGIGDYDEAAESFRLAIERAPDQILAYRLLVGLLRYELDRPEEADRWMQRLSAAQPRVYASVNCAKLITCKMVELTREDQSRGNGIAGNDDSAGMVRLRGGLPMQFPKAYHKLLTFHELRPTRKEPKLAGPAQPSADLRELSLGACPADAQMGNPGVGSHSNAEAKHDP